MFLNVIVIYKFLFQEQNILYSFSFFFVLSFQNIQYGCLLCFYTCRWERSIPNNPLYISQLNFGSLQEPS